MRSRYQGRETVSVSVPLIWLIFYAITVVGALTASRLGNETPEMAAVVGDAHELNMGKGKAAWK